MIWKSLKFVLVMTASSKNRGKSQYKTTALVILAVVLLFYLCTCISEKLREKVPEDNVRVITVAPWTVETELLSHTTSSDIKAGYEDWKRHMGRAIKPEDIAATILYAYQQPQNVCIREIVIAATRQQP